MRKLTSLSGQLNNIKKFRKQQIFEEFQCILNWSNLFVLTKYTGADPEPSLVDYGNSDNGAVVDYSNPNVLAPGMNRRSNYFSARTVTLGVNFNF